jgi:hypothetical protein
VWEMRPGPIPRAPKMRLTAGISRFRIVFGIELRGELEVVEDRKCPDR